MSLFNGLVPFHPWSGVLIFLIRWGTAEEFDDKDYNFPEVYPLSGRLKYVWTDPEFTRINLLLKNGPASWGPKSHNEAVIRQAARHPWHESTTIVEHDRKYIKVVFSVKEDYALARMENMRCLENKSRETGSKDVSLSEDPFELLNRQLKKLGRGNSSGFEGLLPLPIEIWDQIFDTDAFPGKIGS